MTLMMLNYPLALILSVLAAALAVLAMRRKRAVWAIFAGLFAVAGIAAGLVFALPDAEAALLAVIPALGCLLSMKGGGAR